jgi:MFS family permease
MSLRLTLARVCLWLGLGSGLLLGAVVALLAAVANDGLDPSNYELAGIGFALPALVGFVLWFLFGGWIP